MIAIDPIPLIALVASALIGWLLPPPDNPQSRPIVSGHAGSTISPAPDDDDSLSVLLFAGFEVEQLTISARSGLVLDDSAMGSADISHRDGSLVVNGVRRGVCTIRAQGDETIAISIDRNRRRKGFRGIIRCELEGRRIRIVARLPLRDYLAATLATEARPSDPMEYLEALSVLQRNYIRFHRDRHAPLADLCDNTHCQVADAHRATPRIVAAVERASRISLTAGEGLPCYYSGSCGGSTLTPAQIWRQAEPGYSNVSCSHCRSSSRYRWTRTAPATREVQEIVRSAPAPPFVDDDFKIRLGRVVGFNRALSNTFDRIERRGSHYLFAGRGFGHRVGLCQEGAAQLARRGWSAVKILRFYFPEATAGEVRRTKY